MDLGEQSRSYRDDGLGLLIAQKPFELFRHGARFVVDAKQVHFPRSVEMVIQSFYGNAGLFPGMPPNPTGLFERPRQSGSATELVDQRFPLRKENHFPALARCFPTCLVAT
jgi:hypothetical protein